MHSQIAVVCTLSNFYLDSDISEYLLIYNYILFCLTLGS